MDNELDNEAAGAALRTCPTGAVAGGRRLCWCCLLAEPPRTYQDTPEALPVLLPGGAWSAGSSASARKPTGGLQHHPASMALSDELYREESNKCKEAGGAQDDLSNKEDNNEDIDEDKDDNRDDKASNTKFIAAAAEEQT
jgi:hypothetical protein